MIEEASDGDGAPPLLNSTRPHQYPASVLGPTIEFALAHARAHKSRARALLLLAICVCLTCPRPRPAQVTRRGGHRAAAERDQLPDGRLHQWHHDLDGSTRSRLDPDASAMASQLVLDDVVDPRGTLASAAVAPLRERTGAKARRAAREQLSLWHIVGRTNHGRRRCDLTAVSAAGTPTQIYDVAKRECVVAVYWCALHSPSACQSVVSTFQRPGM